MHVSIGLSLGDRERVELLVSRADGTVYLVLGKQVVEIRLERVHVHALAKQLPVALAALARVDADATACRDAREVGDRAERLRGRLLDESVAADTVGDHERARELRGMADTPGCCRRGRCGGRCGRQRSVDGRPSSRGRHHPARPAHPAHR